MNNDEFQISWFTKMMNKFYNFFFQPILNLFEDWNAAKTRKLIEQAEKDLH